MSDQIITKTIKNNNTDSNGKKELDSIYINVCPCCGSQLFGYRCNLCQK